VPALDQEDDAALWHAEHAQHAFQTQLPKPGSTAHQREVHKHNNCWQQRTSSTPPWLSTASCSSTMLQLAVPK
jgi:hypothetical protein